jgi:hypothetical protein
MELLLRIRTLEVRKHATAKAKARARKRDGWAAAALSRGISETFFSNRCGSLTKSEHPPEEEEWTTEYQEISTQEMDRIENRPWLLEIGFLVSTDSLSRGGSHSLK